MYQGVWLQEGPKLIRWADSGQVMKVGSPALEPHCLSQTEKEPESIITITSRPTGGLTRKGCQSRDPNQDWGVDRSFWRRGHLSWARPGIGDKVGS